MDRRRFLKLTAATGAGLVLAAGGGGALWLSGSPAPVAGFATIDEARAWLARAGTMHHGTTEPIPGAPALVETSLAAAAARLDGALAAFAAHGGALQPHFAYGALDRRAYTRAHLMHLAEHAADIEGVA